MTYDHLSLENLRGATQADYLVALDGHFYLKVDDTTLFDEPGFPVVELARGLAHWLSDSGRCDFEFDSMSYEELGALFIRRKATGWTVGSIFAPGANPVTISWEEVEQSCRGFIAAVEDDPLQMGIDPHKVIL